MRSKDEILHESQRFEPETPKWEITTSLHERLTIELLIDIRDILDALKLHLTKMIENSKETD